jgi:trimeric autotransporter adhesin
LLNNLQIFKHLIKTDFMKKYIFLFGAYSVLSTASFAQSWALSGNSGTSPSTNFLGTTDNNALVFKTNNVERLRLLATGNLGIGFINPLQKLDINGNINIGKGFCLFMENHRVLRVDSINGNIFLGNGTGALNASGFYNTVSGYQAFSINKIGNYNTANGAKALASNTSGNSNVANGAYALFSNNTGGYNTATGFEALYRNTSGTLNSATGVQALFSNTSGGYNVANGAYALIANITGSYNVANGAYALISNTTGNYNVANGAYTLHFNNGSNNTAHGYAALYTNISGADNSAMGSYALYNNIKGNSNTATGYTALYNNTGSINTAHGAEALYSNTTGNYNTAQGNGALYSNISGYFNTAVGFSALYNTPSSWANTAVGDRAGASYANGWNNTFIGAGADAGNADIYNSIALGNIAIVYAPNQVRIGNSFTNSIGGYANWTNISDGRVKKNIKENVPGLTFINKLKPITYNLNLDAADKITQASARKDKDGKAIATSQQEINARNAKQQIVYTGFVAQDVEKAAKELNYDFSGVDAAKNTKDLYGLRYSEFAVPLVKAVQELSKISEGLREKNDSLQQQINELKTLVQKNNQGGSLSQAMINTSLSDASLEQNIPNPFTNTTAIRYNLSQKFTNAQIIITDKSGRTIKQINIHGAGKGIVNIEASMLSAGTYSYSLVVDGKPISSKQMVLVR